MSLMNLVEFLIALVANDLVVALVLIIAMRRTRYPFIKIITKVVSMQTQTLDCTKKVALDVALKSTDTEGNELTINPEGLSGLEFKVGEADAEFGTIANEDGKWTFDPGLNGAKGVIEATVHYTDGDGEEYDLAGECQVTLEPGGPATLSIEFKPV